jgi:hypothetical protein
MKKVMTVNCKMNLNSTLKQVGKYDLMNFGGSRAKLLIETSFKIIERNIKL